MNTVRKIDDYKIVLAVEEYSDRVFFAEVLEHLGKIDETFIQHFNGASDLLVKLETFLSPGLLAEKASIGVVVDADANAAARIQSVSNVLQKATGRSIQHGVWSPVQPNQAQVGFFVVPDGQQHGEIESLAWQSWANDPPNAAQRQCIDEYLGCMQALGQVAKSPDKGRISALLAIRNDEDPRLGPGARAKVFSFDRPEFQLLLDFLRQL